MNATQERKTCADLIASELADREQHLTKLYEDMNSDDQETADNAGEEVNEMAYAVNVYSVAKVIWSGGGPADWIEITYNKYDLKKVEYIYQDWYDVARVDVKEGSSVWRYAEEMLEGLNA
jgi:hypothetical protein